MSDQKFKVEWCSLCERYMVMCPKCGNNCCNGTYGDDGKCKVCKKAYDYQDHIDPDTGKYIE